MSTSLIAGLQEVEGKAEAVLLGFGDKPFVSSRSINQILDEYNCQSKGIVDPYYYGKSGNPVVISLKYRNGLLDLKGDIEAREKFPRHSQDVQAVEIDSPAVLSGITGSVALGAFRG